MNWTKVVLIVAGSVVALALAVQVTRIVAESLSSGDNAQLQVSEACRRADELVAYANDLSGNPDLRLSGLPATEAIPNVADALRNFQTADPALNAALVKLANEVTLFTRVFNTYNGRYSIDWDRATRAYGFVENAHDAVSRFCD